MNNKKIVVILFLVACIISKPVLSQMVGNPASVKGNGEFTLSVSGTYLHHVLSKETAISKRVLCKATWGATSRIDLFVTLGSVGLRMKVDQSGITEYEDKKRFAIGLGLNAELISPTPDTPYHVWINAKALRFKSSGFYTVNVPGTSDFYQSDLVYDWREVQVSLCFKYNLSAFSVYGGALGWVLQRHDERIEVWHGEYWGPERQVYQTGMWTGALVGIEVPLPYAYAISIESTLFNEDNYQIMLGITQTGLQ